LTQPEHNLGPKNSPVIFSQFLKQPGWLSEGENIGQYIRTGENQIITTEKFISI
jgi:hypothetical protein